jgi:hypothetical protein
MEYVVYFCSIVGFCCFKEMKLIGGRTETQTIAKDVKMVMDFRCLCGENIVAYCPSVSYPGIN